MKLTQPRLLPILTLALACGCAAAAPAPAAPSAPPTPPAPPTPSPAASAPPSAVCPGTTTPRATPFNAADAAAVAACVEQRYGTIRSFRASFTQTDRVKMQSVSKISTGDVTFEKPDRMRWEYDPPRGSVAISGGGKIEIYDPANKQPSTTSAADSPYSALLAFLTGRGLVQYFLFRLLDPVSLQAPGMYVLECTPRQDTPAYRKFLLYVDDRTYDVRRALILDAQGNQNRIELGAPTLDQPVPAGAFTMVLPPGATVVKMP